MTPPYHHILPGTELKFPCELRSPSGNWDKFLENPGPDLMKYYDAWRPLQGAPDGPMPEGRPDAPTTRPPEAGTPQALTHELKTWPPYFGYVIDGSKTFEVRKADRPFANGDTLYLREWDPSLERYSGRETRRTISYVMHGPAFGLASGYCILGLAPQPASDFSSNPHDHGMKPVGEVEGVPGMAKWAVADEGDWVGELARKLFPELCTGLSDDTAEFMRKLAIIRSHAPHRPDGEGKLREAAKDAVEAMDALIILAEQHVQAPYAPLKERLVRDRLKAALTQPPADQSVAQEGDKWTEKPPTEQGTYWHWNGDNDSSPLPIFVLYSGFSGKCFVSMGQLGMDHATDCDEYGGWWKPLRTPKTPEQEELDSIVPLSPTTPPKGTSGTV